MTSFLYLFITATILSVLLYVIALVPSVEKATEHRSIAYNEVQGMAIESEGILYTLNFEQQKRVIGALVGGKEIPEIKTCAVNPEKLIIYRFDKPEIVITFAK